MATKQSAPRDDRVGGERGMTASRMMLPRRRRPVVLLLGIVLCVTGGLVGGWMATTMGDTVMVLAVAKPIAYGAAIEDADLKVVRLRADPGVSVVPASQRQNVVGKLAATDLTGGSLLSRGSVMAKRTPGPGEELVGVSVDSSRMPRRPLHAQDQVMVVSTPPEDADPSDNQPEQVEATVVSVGRPDDDGVRVVDLRVPAGAGPALAARAATGRIAIVLESPGG